MKRLVLLAVMISTQAFAGDIPDLPINGTYAEAASKAQTAALIQTGIQGQIDSAKNMVGNYAVEKAKHLGLAKPVGAILYCARVYRDKAIELRMSEVIRLKFEIRKASLTYNF